MANEQLKARVTDLLKSKGPPSGPLRQSDLNKVLSCVDTLVVQQLDDAELLQKCSVEQLTATGISLGAAILLKEAFPGAGGAGASAAAGGGSSTAPADNAFEQRLAALEAKQYTITDIAGLGRVILKAPPVEFRVLGVTPLAKDTRQLEAQLMPLVQEMEGAKSEEELQGPIYKSIKLLAEFTGSSLHILDTHKRGFGGMKTQLPDISLSVTSEKLIAQLVAFIELKVSLAHTSQQSEVLGQMKERLSYVLQQQPGRDWALSMGLSGKNLVVMKVNQQGVVQHTPFIAIDWLNPVDLGWQILVGWLATKPYKFGFCDPTKPPPINLPDGSMLMDCTAMVSRRTVAVYKGVISSQRGSKVGVLKAGPHASISHEATLLALPSVKDCKHLPTLLATGSIIPRMQGGFDQYLLIAEYGVHIPSAAAPAAIIRYIGDAARGIAALASAGYNHCDISPDNLVVAWDRSSAVQPSQATEEADSSVGQDSVSMGTESSDPELGSSEQCSTSDSIEAAMENDSDQLVCIVLDLHVAKPCNDSMRPPAVSGKPAFFGLSVHFDLRNSVLADLESLFLCALDIASDGAAIRWRQAPCNLGVHDTMLDIKCSSLLIDVIWETKVLARCNAELRDWLNQLRQLFYPAAPMSDSCRYRNKDVTPDDVINKCDEARRCLAAADTATQMVQ